MSELQKATDIIIGEATKTLLENDDEISFETLLQVISEQYASLQDESRKPAFRHALSELRKYITLATRGADAGNGDEHDAPMSGHNRPDASDTSH